MNILDRLLGVITDPARTFKEVSREEPIGWSFLVFSGTTIMAFWVSSLTLGEAGSLVQQSRTGFILGGLISSILFHMILTGFLNLVARGFKGTGSYWGIFSALSFSHFPHIFLPTGLLLGVAIGRGGNGFSGFVSFAITLWVAVLNVIALRESQGFSTGKAILTWLLAFAILFFIIVLPIILLVFPVLKNPGLFMP
jgi:hypothetical protein